MPYWKTVEDPEYFDDDAEWQDLEDYEEDEFNDSDRQPDTLPG